MKGNIIYETRVVKFVLIQADKGFALSNGDADVESNPIIP